MTMLTFFRHKGAESPKTSHIQGRNHNGATNQTNKAREVCTEPGHKQS